MTKIDTLDELEKVIGVSLSRYYPENLIEHTAIKVSMVMDSLACSVKDTDLQAIDDACKIIAIDLHMPFGKIIKSNLARALKKNALHISKKNKQSIVEITASILSLEHCPREAEDYCKLIKKCGINEIQSVIKLSNPVCTKAQKLIGILKEYAI